MPEFHKVRFAYILTRGEDMGKLLNFNQPNETSYVHFGNERDGLIFTEVNARDAKGPCASSFLRVFPHARRARTTVSRMTGGRTIARK